MKELCLVNRDDKGDIETIVAMSNSKSHVRDFVFFEVSKMSFDAVDDYYNQNVRDPHFDEIELKKSDE